VSTAQDRLTLSRRAGALAAFTKHPSWPEFELVVEEKIARLRRTAATIALLDTGADQRKLDQIRGTIAALKWFTGVPPNAQGTLEEFLREQGLEVPDE
jgi:hypothetical protein